VSTWDDLSQDSLLAAKRLLDAHHSRSAVSRAYFAAYAAITSKLSYSVQFGAGRDNPTHGQIAELTLNNLRPDRFNKSRRQGLTTIIRNLQRNRLTADYSPHLTLDRETALASVREASRLVAELEGV